MSQPFDFETRLKQETQKYVLSDSIKGFEEARLVANHFLTGAEAAIRVAIEYLNSEEGQAALDHGMCPAWLLDLKMSMVNPDFWRPLS